MTPYAWVPVLFFFPIGLLIAWLVWQVPEQWRGVFVVAMMAVSVAGWIATRILDAVGQIRAADHLRPAQQRSGRRNSVARWDVTRRPPQRLRVVRGDQGRGQRLL